MDTFFNSNTYMQFLLEHCNDDKGDTHGRVSGGHDILAYLSELGIAPNDRVLEIGCGVGRVLKLLRDDFGADVYGCDVSGVALDHIRRTSPDLAERLWQLDSYGLALYPPASFDMALYWGVYELVPQATHLMQLAGLLKVGGKAMLGSVKPLESLPDDEVATAARAAYETKRYPINLTAVNLLEQQIDYLGFKVAKRLVFDRRKDVTDRRYSVDQGGSDRRFGEAIYIIEKVRETPLSASASRFFGERPVVPGYTG